MWITLALSVLFVLYGEVNSDRTCACFYWTFFPDERCVRITASQNLLTTIGIAILEINGFRIDEADFCTNLTESTRAGFYGSIDIFHNSDGSDVMGYTINTFFGDVYKHVHINSNGAIVGGDEGISFGTGRFLSGVHRSFDMGKGESFGVHTWQGAPGLAVVRTIDVDANRTLSFGGSQTLTERTLGGNMNSKGEPGTSVGLTIPVPKTPEENSNGSIFPLVSSGFL